MNPCYFGSSKEPLFGIYHPPLSAATIRPAVLICPPLALEYMRAHWCLRRLADQLAMAGFHVLRFDYYGTGDSAGNSEEADVARWQEDIRCAADEVLEMSNSETLSIVGLRAGAALAATTQGLHVHRAILWDPVVSGRTYVEQLRQLHRSLLDQHNAIGRYIEATPEELLGYSFPQRLQDEIELLDLRKAFPLNTNEVLLFSSKATKDLFDLDQALRSHGTASRAQVLEDAGDWERFSSREDALLPNSIPPAIVSALLEA